MRITETVGLDASHPMRFDLLRASIQRTRACFPTTDIYVFHEDYTEHEFVALAPLDVTDFIRVDFSGREHLRNPTLRRPYGYLMMCRFFSGWMQQYPQLQAYTHHMRLDDDSYFQDPFLTEDYVKSQLLKHDYVYRSTFTDDKDQQSLFDFTLDFLRKEGYDAHIETLKGVLRNQCFLQGDRYTGLAPYNNFHIASQRLWQNPLVQRYIQALDDANGILKQGWMDANVHAMIVYVLTLFCGMKIHHDGSFGYRHNQHVSVLDSTAVKYDESLPFGV
jgi:hypothetical protein